MHGYVLPLTDVEPRHVSAWSELAGRAIEPNPFFEPECVLPAARHLAGDRVGLLVVEGSAGEWLACAPVTSRLHVGHASLPVLSTWRHPYSFLGTPLVARESVESAAAELVAGASRAGHLGLVAFPWLGEDGPVAAALLAAIRQRGRQPAAHRSFERAIVHRSALADGLDALITRGHRKDLARLGRRLAETLDAPLELRDESASAAGVERFLVVENSGWKGERGTAFACREAHAQFFRDLCDGFRAAGRLQLLALGSDSRTVSCKCNLLAGDAVFCFKIAFDEQFKRFRPGLQLELRMLEEFRERMAEDWMDSCADEHSPLFEHFWPGRRRIGSYVVAGGVLAWTIEAGASRLAHAR